MINWVMRSCYTQSNDGEWFKYIEKQAQHIKYCSVAFQRMVTLHGVDPQTKKLEPHRKVINTVYHKPNIKVLFSSFLTNNDRGWVDAQGRKFKITLYLKTGRRKYC